MLCDDGTGNLFDDPGAPVPQQERRLYFTIQGTLISTGQLKSWGAPELAAYFAALLAEFHAEDRGGGRDFVAGQGKWWRPLAWFANDRWDPPQRVILPFSKSLLENGLKSLETRELISRKRVLHDPRNPSRRFYRPRNIYQNRFATSGVPLSHYGGASPPAANEIGVAPESG